MFELPGKATLLVSLTMISLTAALFVGNASAGEVSTKGTAPVPGAQPATITLMVPLDAIVYIDGRRTYNSGMTRRFVTPPLAPGHKYFYDVKVSWIDGAQAREISRRLSFRAGAHVVLHYSQPNWRETARDLWLDPVAPYPGGTRYYEDVLSSPYYLNPFYVFPGYHLYPR